MSTGPQVPTTDSAVAPADTQQPDVNQSVAGPGTGNQSVANNTSDNTTSEGIEKDEADVRSKEIPPEGNSEYPPQLHAGKVGLGPEYGRQKGDEKSGIGAKITGLKEEVKGKITRNQELAQKGHDRRTGELAQQARAKDDEDPFAEPAQPGEVTDKNSSARSAPLEDNAAKEQAATTHPEGTEAAERQATEGTELKRDITSV